MRYQLGSVTLTDVVFFKNATFKFEPGVTTIRGLNKNDRSRNQTNAVGKSVLVSCIASVLRSAPPMASAKVDRAAFLTKPTSSIHFDLKVDGVPYSLQQRRVKTSTKYAILKNGRDIKVRTTPLAEKYINQLVQVSDAEMYSLFYLDGRRPFILQHGSHAVRMNFFINLFRLNDIDQIRKRLESKNADFAKLRTQRTVLVGELVDAQHVAKKFEVAPKDHEKLRKLNSKWILLDKQYRKLGKRLHTATLESNAAAKRASIESAVKRVEWASAHSVNLIHNQVLSAKEWSAYESALKSWEAATSKIRKKLARLEVPKVGADSEEKLAELATQTHKLEAFMSNYEQQRDEFEKELSQLRSKAVKLVDVAKPHDTTELSKAHNRLLDLRNLSSATKGKAVCPTCGTKLRDSVVSKFRSLKHDLKEVEQRIEEAKAYEQLSTLTNKASEIKNNLAKLGSSKAKTLKKVRAEYKQLKAAVNASVQYSSLVQQLKALRKPKKPKIKLLWSEKKRNKIIFAYKQWHSLTDELESLPVPKTVVEDVTAVADQYTKVGSSMALVKSKIDGLQSKVAACQTAESSVTRLQQRIKELDDQLGDSHILAALVKAYGKKGLKMAALQQIAVDLEANLNEYSGLLFAEPIKFTINVTETAFNILYTRKNTTADIRYMSGAESRLFALLHLASALPLLPDSCRFDTVIMDEMDANVSETSRRMIAQNFLPFLLTVVPKVVVVTPDTRTPYPGRQLVVVKQGSESKIVDQQGAT